MKNKFENYATEEFMKLCFADDSGKYKNEDGYRFWKNFREMNINVWDGCPKIYNYSKNYNALPDPDINSFNLYEAHIKVWNKQCEKFKNEKINENIKNIKRHGMCRCEVITEDEQIILGSDSIMNIYWHWNYGDMPRIMEDICKNVHNELQDAIKNLRRLLNLEQENICNNKNYSLYKEFIRHYLQYTNTIGGFMLFPRHNCSINQLRGKSAKIQDRFDLTLECIRRMYEKNFSADNNPLFDISENDKKFFKMFGKGKKGFKNYAKFFCLNESYDGKHNWVTEDCLAVYDLLSENNKKTLPIDEKWISTDNILPKTKDQWWTFYNNIMLHLEARNEQIRKLIVE